MSKPHHAIKHLPIMLAIFLFLALPQFKLSSGSRLESAADTSLPLNPSLRQERHSTQWEASVDNTAAPDDSERSRSSKKDKDEIEAPPSKSASANEEKTSTAKGARERSSEEPEKTHAPETTRSTEKMSQPEKTERSQEKKTETPAKEKISEEKHAGEPTPKVETEPVKTKRAYTLPPAQHVISGGRMHEIDIKIVWTDDAVYVVLMAVGALFCIAGYRLFGLTLFLQGLVLGCYLGWLIVNEINGVDVKTNDLELLEVLGMLLLGFGGGFLAVFLWQLGVFLTGALFGLIFGSVTFIVALTDVYPDYHTIIAYSTMGVFGVLFGLLAVKYERPVLIVCTACAGAYWVLRSVGYFLGGYPQTIDDFKHNVNDIPEEYWGYLGASIVLGILGTLLQFLYTAKDVDYSRRRGYYPII